MNPMSADSQARPTPDELQFDQAIDTSADGSSGGAEKLVCAGCQAPLRREYFQVNGQVSCASCKDAVEASVAQAHQRSRGAGPVFRALLFGLGAAIVGAIIYFAVIKITGLELSLITILIGFMVGTAVMKGSRSHGGRRFQVISVLMTYFAIGLAFSSAVVSEMADDVSQVGDSTAAEVNALRDSVQVIAAGDSVTAGATGFDSVSSPNAVGDSAGASTATTADGSGAVQIGPGMLLLGLGGALLFVLALPVMVVVGSMPGGLLSAVIIGFGLLQAWTIPHLTRQEISGPYKVGTPPPQPVASPVPAT